MEYLITLYQLQIFAVDDKTEWLCTGKLGEGNGSDLCDSSSSYGSDEDDNLLR